MSSDRLSLHEQLANAEQDLALIQERKAEYVLAEDVPLQLIKNERALEQRIAHLREQLTAPRSERDQRNRTTLLGNVQAAWIAGVLDQSLHKMALINLGMQPRPDAVYYPWDSVLHRPDTGAAAA